MSNFEKLDSYFRSDSLKKAVPSENAAKQKREKLMRLTKLLLPAIAAALIGLLAVLPGLQNRELDLQLNAQTPKIADLEKLHMENTVFYITDKNNKVSNFTAETIDETEPGSQLMKLINPEGMIPADNKNLVYVNSPTGYYDQNKKLLSLTDGVSMNYSGGLKGKTREMFYDSAAGKAYGLTPVTAAGELGTLQAEGFDYFSDRDVLIFNRNVRITLNQKQPLEITAEEKAELYQTENKMVAVGNAYAADPKTNIRANRLTAYFAKNADTGKNKISRFLADENVVIRGEGSMSGFGTRFEYEADKDQMTLTGKPAKLKDKASTITAYKSIIYYPSHNKAVASGNALAEDGQNKIYADTMEAYFSQAANGTSAMERAEMPHKVKIVTADGEVTADKGIYYPQKRLVKLYDNVVITQNGNVLRGARAETDLNTGISRLLSGKSRVSGVFWEENLKSGNKGK